MKQEPLVTTKLKRSAHKRLRAYEKLLVKYGIISKVDISETINYLLNQVNKLKYLGE